MNIYSSPEKFGLSPVGEIEWSDACYQFDLTAVWKMNGKLFYAEDSGCSCPVPFEDQGLDDIVEVTATELQDHLEKRNTVNYYGNRSAQITELMGRVIL